MARARYDHFHLFYVLPGSDERHEIEGGWTCFPDDWEQRSESEQWQWWHQLGVSWGMPTEGIVKKVNLAG